MGEVGIAEMITEKLTICGFKPMIFQPKMCYEGIYIPGVVITTFLTLAVFFCNHLCQKCNVLRQIYKKTTNKIYSDPCNPAVLLLMLTISFIFATMRQRENKRTQCEA